MNNLVKSILIIVIFVSHTQTMAFYDGFDMTSSDVESLILQNEIDLSKYDQKLQKIIELQSAITQIDQKMISIVQQLNTKSLDFKNNNVQDDLYERMQFEKLRIESVFTLEKLLQIKNEYRRKILNLR